jgi:hypothetical protein
MKHISTTRTRDWFASVFPTDVPFERIRITFFVGSQLNTIPGKGIVECLLMSQFLLKVKRN